MKAKISSGNMCPYQFSPLGFGIRFCICFLIFLIYVKFMSNHAPNGLDWASYHSNRIFNVVEYLRLNGYSSAYGFSIWSSCTDCDLMDPTWKEKIYISSNAVLSLWPYIVINEIGGRSGLLLYGPILDRTIIFATGVILAELLLTLINSNNTNANTSTKHLSKVDNINQTSLLNHWIVLVTFLLYCSSVWSYQMIRAMWNEIWFLLFFLISLGLLLRANFKLACLIIFFGACMHYMLGFVLAFVYLTFDFLSRIFSEKKIFNTFVPNTLISSKRLYVYCLSALLPTLINYGLRVAYLQSGGSIGAGSSLLFRMGVSGNDIHNGGIVGALQFLGGARISLCINQLIVAESQKVDLLSKISAFNCALSVSGLTLVSLLAIIGVFFIQTLYIQTRAILFPMGMSLIILASFLQQSFSVHLLGHSYPFAALFSVGIVGLCLKTLQLLKHKALSILLLSPLIFAILLLSIRVSMINASNLI